MVLKRIRRWLSETHSAQFELVRHFFSQQFAYELTSSDQVRRFFVATLGAFGCVGPLIIRLYIPKYAYLQGLPTPGLYLAAVHADRLFFISLSMIAVGFITAVQWQDLFPNRQDYLTLKPLPLQLYQIFVARFLASLTIATIVIVDLNLATSVLFPLLTSGKWQCPSFGISYIFAHAIATFGAGLFVFFAITAIQAAERPDPKTTFGWFVEYRYLPMREGRWHRATKDKTSYEINRYLGEYFRDRSLGEVTQFELQVHLNRLAQEFSQIRS